MRYLVAGLALALLPRCDAAPATAQVTGCTDSSSVVESRIDAELDASGLANVAVLIERGDGRQYLAEVGTPNERYISSSTAKPIMIAAVLDQVALGTLSLTSRAADVLPGYAANATGSQLDVELHHLLSMTSGLTGGTLCWREPDWPAYVACVEALPSEIPEREPGEAMTYSTQHLDVAGLMAVVAGGYADWAALFDDWRTRHGLFAGATWNAGYIFAASVQLNVTAAEYLDFLDAVDGCTILPARLCTAMQADTIPLNPGRAPAYGWHGEDWHFGFGLWAECRTADFDCPRVNRVSSIGVAGQYAVIDREHGYRFVITATFAGLSSGLDFHRSIEPLLREWARLP